MMLLARTFGRAIRGGPVCPRCWRYLNGSPTCPYCQR